MTLLQFYSMHSDAVSGCSLHPFLPYLATSSGQRHVDFPNFSDDESGNSEDEDLKLNSEENTLKLWSFELIQKQIEEQKMED